MARPRRVGRKIDFKQWESIPRVLNESASDTIVSGGSIGFLIPATILRCRGRVWAQFDATMQVGDRMDLTFALGIISTDAFTLGATAFPDPAGEPEYPWLWWDQITLNSELTAGHTGGFGPEAQMLEIDTKAMRKVKPGESLFFCWQQSGASGAPVTIVNQSLIRVLIGT